MNEDRDLNRLLDAWFAEGPVQVADRVIDGTANRIARQRQTPAWRLHSWRFPTMSTPIKLVAIGAALVAALAAGAVLVGGGGRTAVPTPTPVPPNLPDGELKAGTYIGQVLPPDPLTWTVTVPAGWSGYDEWAVLGPEAPDDKGVVVGPILHANVPADSCAAAGTVPATSVDELVAAVQARNDWIVSEPVDTTLGGFSGTRINVEVPEDVTVCGPSKEDYIVLVENLDGSGWYAQGPSNRFDLWILDVEGRPVVVMRNSYADSPPEHMSQSDEIIDSIVITP